MPDPSTASQLDFSADIYSPVAVERAVAVFGDLAKFTVSHGEAAVSVTWTEPDADVADVLADELANYALNETILLHRAPSTTLR
ncbi:MAG: hypothetical protein EP329_04645 [Deltaproteobacteria bacterium]|nr:MAG: hypothetical protein EP329_04645 [Deltaproteobacteria bacterium]